MMHWSLIASRNVSSMEKILAPGTVQSRALKWLVEKDGARWEEWGGSLTNEWDDQLTLERYALAVLWYSTTADGGWKSHENWLVPSVSVCDWHGVKCANEWRERVTDMSLPDNGLNGEIPSELKVLKYLMSLDFSGNKLRGALPDSIGELEYLEVLFIQHNILTGSVPISVCALKKRNEQHEAKSGWIEALLGTASAEERQTPGTLRDIFADCSSWDEPIIECNCCQCI